MKRIEHLNKYLSSLTGINDHGEYDNDIRTTINEINMELGIGTEVNLSSYSTKELHEELAEREGVDEIVVRPDQELTLEVLSGDIGQSYPFSGAVRILVNRD